MMEFLDKLRQKPERTRKRIAFVTTLTIFGMIMGTWWGTWTLSSGSEGVQTNVSPLEAVVAPIQYGKDSLSQALPSLNEVRTQIAAIAVASASTTASSSDEMDTDPSSQMTQYLSDPSTDGSAYSGQVLPGPNDASTSVNDPLP